METATEGDQGKQQWLDETLGKLRACYGRSVVYFGNVHDASENAPMRISFTHIPDEKVEGRQRTERYLFPVRLS